MSQAMVREPSDSTLQPLAQNRTDHPVRRILMITPPDIDAGAFNYVHCRSGRYANYPAYGSGVLARTGLRR